ncbi:MAG: MFS transporter [Actinomycetota bacterium]
MLRRRSIGRPFQLLWWAVVVSSTGDGMFITAFPLLAVTLTGDPLLIAGVTIAARAPWLLFSMITGAIADRMDRRRLMVGADVVRVVIVGAFGITIALDAANIWMLYGCAFLLGIGETLHVNAGQAILPAMVVPGELMEANARFASGQIATAQFIGPPLGALMFNAAAALPFLADAVSFAGSAALLAATPDVHAVEPPTTRLRDDVRDALVYIWHHRPLRRLTEMLTLINFFSFSASSLLVLYTKQRLHSGTVVYTALLFGAAAGTVLSRWFVTRMWKRLGTVRTMRVSFWLWATALTGLAFTTSPLMAIAMYVLLGVGNGLWLVVNTTVRQRMTPRALMGRMNAVHRTVSWGVVPFGAAFGGWLAKLFGLRAPFFVAAAALLVVAAFGARIMRPLLNTDAP